MSSRQVRIEQCYVLHSRAYQDNSLILQCFSYEVGLISLIARGARKSKKNTLALLQPFKLLSISYLGSKDLKILTGVEEVAQYALLGKPLYCAYYLNELLLRLLIVDDDSSGIFDVYQKTLIELKNNNPPLDKILRLFEMQLLYQLGYQPNLTEDLATGFKVEEFKNYYFDPLSGPYEVEKMLEKSQLYSQKLCFSGKSLLAISALNLQDSNVLKESKILLRLILQCHLGDKPLKSREVYKQLYAK